MFVRRATVVLAMMVFALGCSGGGKAVSQHPSTTFPAASKTVLRVDHGATYRVMRENGSRSPNRTDIRWDVYGADTSSMFSFRGRTYILYQDNFGGPAVPFGTDFFSVSHADWRSQTLAVSSDQNPADGLTIDRMITDRPGHAKELIRSPHDSMENTLAPSYGTALGNRMYLHYLSVQTEGPDFLHWVCNDAGTAYSDDGGQTWVKRPPTWLGNTNFVQVAIVQRGPYTYLFGVPCITPAGGGVQLARVPSNALLVRTAYRYWTGTTWSTDIRAAKTIVAPDVWQFSVRYNAYYKKWIMMTGSRVLGLHLYTADAATGPWSQPQTVLAASYSRDAPHDFEGYAPMITPNWNTGPDIWFMVSNIHTYDVSLWHTALTPAGAPRAPRTPLAAPATSGAATLHWTAPETISPSSITGYVVTPYYRSNPAYQETFSLSAVTFSTTATTQTIRGLTRGTAYTFKVAAKNALGTGPQSAASNAVTAG